MSREQAMKAANDLADKFNQSAVNDELVSLFADSIQESYKNYNNISLRDYFAGKAMSGILVHLENHMERHLDLHDEDIAKFAYRQADAMLEVRGES